MKTILLILASLACSAVLAIEPRTANTYQLSEGDGRLNMKVKHFTADFVAWEDKPDFVNFKLVGIEQNAVHFSGLSLHRIDEDTMHGFIVMKMKDGSLREEKLVYHRRQF